MASLPIRIAPAASSFLITNASSSNFCPAKPREPHSVGCFFTANRSFAPYGMPCSGPRVRSRFRSPSTSLAFLSALWRCDSASALWAAPIFSRRSQKARVSSTAEYSLARRPAERSPILAKNTSPERVFAAMMLGLEACRRLDGARQFNGGQCARGVLNPSARRSWSGSLRLRRCAQKHWRGKAACECAASQNAMAKTRRFHIAIMALFWRAWRHLVLNHLAALHYELDAL